MKKLQVAFAALAAVAGIGGAYASTHKSSDAARVGTIYNWYTVGGNSFVLAGTTVTAKTLICPANNSIKCARGTVGGVIKVTLLGKQ
ncbi:hypothetical protein [Chitinophaga sp. HK235]|uniref:hypothetical protein n=1 Tax=Chitinophaga sp. HK235 TaxID=2952571 RepID=UPI001BA9F549|nr:hypothetical protein [Chitinophaga sp. HK235]